MKPKRISLLLAFIIGLFFTSNVHATKVLLKSGKLTGLKKEKSMLVKFDYSDMTVGKNLPEAQYVDQKVKEHNAKEKGKGDKWKASWVNARQDRYQPKFLELFNKRIEDGVHISEDATGTKYTLIVKTDYTEPGYNVGVWREDARVNFTFYIVETENNANVIAEMTAMNVPGAQVMGYDFDAGSRLAESYAKGAKMLADFITKNLK